MLIYDTKSIPVYCTGCPFFVLHGNVPFFDPDGTPPAAAEYYSPLDPAGRCGTCWAILCPALLPQCKRRQIGSVHPSGWHTVRYPSVIKGGYLYNRCHLIGHQLTGKNAKTENLITGTRYMSIDDMLFFESKIVNYIRSTGDHVICRVTLVFVRSELVARGGAMEGWSLEDHGQGISFCFFAHNVQPGININYATSDSAIPF